MTEYKKIEVVSVDLSRAGPGARDVFVKTLVEELRPGKTYSFIGSQGNTCSSAIWQAFVAVATMQNKFMGFLTKVLDVAKKVVLIPNIVPPDLLYEYVQNTKNKFVVPTGLGSAASDDDGMQLALASAAIAILSDEARISLGTAIDGEKGASPSEQPTQPGTADDDEEDLQAVTLAPDPKDAPTDDPQRLASDDDEDASQEQVALASDAEDARSDEADQQPATDDDDEEASQEQAALASDAEDARSDEADQQPATDDDDEEASHEEVAIKSDAEDAPTDDGAVMETAKGEVGVTPTVADQAAPQLTASTPVIPGDGFSFSAFAKQGVPVEVAKEALPADHLSPEGIPGSGMPAGESALPDVASEDVGNAAPGNERVVHHGDLVP